MSVVSTLGQRVRESLAIVRLEQGARHRKCSSDFSTIMWPVFSRLWQSSRKKSEAIGPMPACTRLATHDRLVTTICATDRLTAT